jgi:phage-related protein
MTIEQILEAILNAIVGIFLGVLNALIAVGEAVISAIIWIINATLQMVQWLAEAIGTILSFFGHLIIGVINAIISLFGGFIALIVMIIGAVINFVIAVVENIIQVIQVVALVIDIILGIAGLVVGWFFQVLQIGAGILANVSNATPQAIPGLPHCVSAPMDSQLCAVWYVLDWTILADGTPGAFIVPIVVLMIDLVIIVYVIGSIFKLVRWFQGVLQIT